MNPDINTRIQFELTKEFGEIFGGIVDGYYSPLELEIALTLIRKKINETSNQFIKVDDFGMGNITVDFFYSDREPEITNFKIHGISIPELESFVDALYGSKATNFSQDLIISLENAYENLKKNTKNPLIIAHFRTKDKLQNLYLIAKDPHENTYFGVIDNQFVFDKQITAIPFENIHNFEYLQQPFTETHYQELFEQQITPEPIKAFFENDKKFQMDTIFLHYGKSKNYKENYSHAFLEALNLSKGFDGLKLAFELTKKVKNYENVDGEDVFTYSKNMFGLENFINIIDFLPLLTKFCFGCKDKEHLFHLLSISKDGQLIEFKNRLEIYNNEKTIVELVELLNKVELSPYITEKKLDQVKFNKDLLILNSYAYENIFKKYLTEEMISPYRKK